MATPTRITFPPAPPLPTYSEDATPLCPNCLQAHPDWALWCPSCNVPVNDTATVDPLRRIYAMGWMWRSLVSRRINRLAFYGAWLYCGGNVIVAVYFIGDSLELKNLATLLTLIGLIHAALLIRITRNWRRRQSHVDEDTDL